MLFWTTRVLRYLEELAMLAHSILKVLRLRKPGMVFLKMISEEGNMLSFVLSLPAAGAADVVKHFRVRFSTSGLAATVKTYTRFSVTVTNNDSHSQLVLALG